MTVIAGTLRQRFVQAGRLETRLRHLEAAKVRQGRAVEILINAHVLATRARVAGDDDSKILNNLLQAHARTVEELATEAEVES